MSIRKFVCGLLVSYTLAKKETKCRIQVFDYKSFRLRRCITVSGGFVKIVFAVVIFRGSSGLYRRREPYFRLTIPGVGRTASLCTPEFWIQPWIREHVSGCLLPQHGQDWYEPEDAPVLHGTDISVTMNVNTHLGLEDPVLGVDRHVHLFRAPVLVIVFLFHTNGKVMMITFSRSYGLERIRDRYSVFQFRNWQADGFFLFS